MTARPIYGALARSAARRRRAALQALRHVAVAEASRDRARAGVTKAQTIVDMGTGAGFDMSSEAEQLAELRQALTIAEAGLDAARRNAGLADAA